MALAPTAGVTYAITGTNVISGGGLIAGVSNVVLGATANASTIDFGGSEAIIDTLSNLTDNAVLTDAAGLTKNGANALVLSASSTFSGQVTINDGSVQISADNALGNAANPVLINGGILQVNTALTFPSTRVISIGAAGGIISNNSTGTINIASQLSGVGPDLLLTGTLSTGANRFFNLTNTGNNFTSNLFVTGRTTVSYGADSELGTGTNTISLLGGDAALQYTGATGTTAHNYFFSTLGGAIDISTAATTLTDSGSLSGSGTFYKAGNGALALTGSSPLFYGNTIVTAGVLSANNSNALGAQAGAVAASTITGISGGTVDVAAGELQVSGGVNFGNKPLQLNGIGQSATTGGALHSTSGNNTFTGAVYLPTAANIAVDSNTLTLAGVVSGTGNLTKVGAGSLVLSGASTNSGATNVNVGTLALTTGASLGETAINVASGATFAPAAGTSAGTSAASLTAASGSAVNLADGTVGNFVLNGNTAGTSLAFAGTSFSIDLSSAADLLTTSGAGSISGMNFVNVSAVGVVSPGTYSIIHTANLVFAAGGSFALSSPTVTGSDGNTYNLSLGSTSTDEQLFVSATSAVPEPGSCAVVIAGAGLLLRRRRLAAKA